MPRECVSEDSGQSIEITWGRDQAHVQVGVRWDRAIVFADEIPSPEQAAVDAAMERLRAQLAEDGRTLMIAHQPLELPEIGVISSAGGWFWPADMTFDPDAPVEVSAPEEPYTSLHVTFTDRRSVNELIRVLRRARDQAYGRDE